MNFSFLFSANSTRRSSEKRRKAAHSRRCRDPLLALPLNAARQRLECGVFHRVDLY
jgi:hypothetical protein